MMSAIVEAAAIGGCGAAAGSPRLLLRAATSVFSPPPLDSFADSFVMRWQRLPCDIWLPPSPPPFVMSCWNARLDGARVSPTGALIALCTYNRYLSYLFELIVAPPDRLIQVKQMHFVFLLRADTDA